MGPRGAGDDGRGRRAGAVTDMSDVAASPVVTIGVLTYGDFPQLARRTIESIRQHCERSAYRLVVGANAVSDATRAYLEGLAADGAIDRLIVSPENLNKCPMMRRMLEGVETEFFWWFDDDSYVISPEALPNRLRTARSSPPGDVMWGHMFYFGHENDFSHGTDVGGWVKRATWYRGLEPPSWNPGGKGETDFQGNGTGDGRWFFITGGCWFIRSHVLRDLGWPDPSLVKRNPDDVLFCEAIRQQGWEFRDIGPCGTEINQEPRRGESEDKATMERQMGRAGGEAALASGISSTGFWRTASAEEHRCDTPLADAIAGLLPPGPWTAIDIGCGTGAYTRILNEHGIACVGFDGNPHTKALSGGLCDVADFSEPHAPSTTYDLVLSLEVGEHIPVQFEQVFLDNLVRYARSRIILSWAIPGQSGTGHVNCRDNAYIIEQMRRRGFTHRPLLSESLRAVVTQDLWWFKQTLMVFDNVWQVPAVLASRGRGCLLLPTFRDTTRLEENFDGRGEMLSGIDVVVLDDNTDPEECARVEAVCARNAFRYRRSGRAAHGGWESHSSDLAGLNRMIWAAFCELGTEYDFVVRADTDTLLIEPGWHHEFARLLSGQRAIAGTPEVRPTRDVQGFWSLAQSAGYECTVGDHVTHMQGGLYGLGKPAIEALAAMGFLEGIHTFFGEDCYMSYCCQLLGIPARTTTTVGSWFRNYRPRLERIDRLKAIHPLMLSEWRSRLAQAGEGGAPLPDAPR